MTYIDGLKAEDWIEIHKPENGLFRQYFDNGQLRYEWYYKDGKRADGISRGWWSNGILKQKWNWKNGKLNGLWELWYSNGQKRYEKTFKDNKRHGELTKWHKNGQIRKKCMWKNSKLDGKWYIWDEHGTLIEERTYKDGEMIASIEEKRNVEREKYVWLQENSEYGQAFHGQQHIEYLLDLNKRDSINSVVDVGTGGDTFVNGQRQV